MKRFLPVLGVLATILAFAALVQTFGLERTADIKWRPLPGGGEIAFSDVTVGTTHEKEYPRGRLSERLAQVVQRRSLSPLWESPGRSSTGTLSKPSFVVWFAYRDVFRSPPLQNSQLLLPDGQIFSTYFYNGGGGRSGLVYTYFDAIPHTAARLVFTTTVSGQLYEWDIPNPSYDPTLRVGTAAALPLTQKVMDYDVTLEKLALRYSEYPPTNWRAEPLFTVRREGKDVSKWFSITSINNERGLLSAPAWKIEATMSRTSAYPFAEDEVEWLGRYDEAQLLAMKPAEYKLFPISDIAHGRGVFIAGLFGPGQYVMKEAKVRASHAPTSLVPPYRPYIVGSGLWRSVTLQKPSLIVVSTDEDVVVFRTESDKQVQVGWQGSLDSGYAVESYDDVPSEALRVGVADRKDPATDGRPVTFLARPPRIPAGVDPRTGQ